MKLAYVIYKYEETGGGVERYVYNLVDQMLQRGHELHLFAARATDVQERILVHPVPVNTLCAPTRILTFARNTAQMLREESYDVIHGFSRTVNQDVYRIGGGSHWRYLLATHRLARTPTGQALLRLNPRNRVILALERERYRLGAGAQLTAISELCKREIVEDFGVNPNKITVIYNPVDRMRFNPTAARTHRKSVRTYHGIVGNRPVALFVGTGFKRKGLPFLIAALGRVPRTERPFLLVAGRDNSKPMRRHASRCGVEQDVIFCGPVQRIEELYGAADYLVFPSQSDAFGQVVLEAMACGLPVIGSGLAGSSEIIHSGENGFVVHAPSRVEALVCALEEMVDPKKRETLSEHAAETARDYTLERNTEQTLALYRSVLELKGRAGGVGAQT